ncbi:MAG: hypothetical protein AAF230_00225 [Pseudomonadota bacterium]
MPLSVGDFLDQLPIRSISLDVPDVVMASRTEGGDVLLDVVGTPLWRGEIALDRMVPAEARQAKALITVAQGGGASFMCYDRAHPNPTSDPGGVLVASAAPTIRALVLDRRLIALEGFPANYRLERGDYISFQYETNPVRTAMHQVVEAEVLASAGGVMPFMEVRPLLQPGAVVGAAVSVSKPAFKAVILPGSVQSGRKRRFVTEGVSFQFVQTLR